MKKRAIPQDLLIKNVELWNKTGCRKGIDIHVRSGKILEILPTGEKSIDFPVINGSGKVLMPSGVDAHVHLRVPGQPQKETPDTGLRAAIKGGYGAVLNMPNTNPPVDSIDVCEKAMSEMNSAIQECGVEVFLSACITRGMKGLEMTRVEELIEWGVKTFTDDGLGVESDSIMAEIFKATARHGIPVSQHAEFKGHGGILAGGSTRSKLNIPLYPSSAEYDMVKRDLNELRKNPSARYHVLHISLAESVQLLAEARREGLNVSCEVTPHHLFFTFEEIPEDNTSFKMNPPLRDLKDRLYVQEALKSGDIDFVATDHAPHNSQEKGCDFHKAPFGTTGMETSLLVLLELKKRGKIDEKRLVEVFSSAPADYLGISDRFGLLEENRPFNAILVDTTFGPHRISEDDLASLSHNNVFLGIDLPGRMETFFNPKFIFETV